MAFRSSHKRSSPADTFHLQRFIDAQAPVYDTVVDELRAGAKRSHWIWFIFPQLAGLGRSPTAARFAISSLAEARAYLDHDIFGWPDNLKVRSSMTLFARATPDNAEFLRLLEKFYGGEQDPATVALLSARP